MKLDEFTQQYIATALWSSVEWDVEDGDTPLDENYGLIDLARETLNEMEKDCAEFQTKNEIDITDDSQAGHDFWLTRNGHGAGFWDGDWPEGPGERMTKSSKKFGEYGLYVGDDGKIYGMKG